MNFDVQKDILTQSSYLKIPTGIKPLIFLLNQSIDFQSFARARAIWALGSSDLVTMPYELLALV